MFKDSFISNDNSCNQKLINNLMKKISLDICCNSCSTDLSNKKTISEKLINQNSFNKILIKNFQIEFIPVGVIKKSKGRKKWSEDHNEVLEKCLNLFGNDPKLIKLFFEDFTETHLKNKIKILKNKKPKLNFKNQRETSFSTNFNSEDNKMNESFGELNSETLKNEIFDFSIDNFILDKKIEENLASEIIKDNTKIFDISFNSDFVENKDNKHFFENIKYEDYNIDNEIKSIFNDDNSVNMNNSIDFDNFFNFKN